MESAQLIDLSAHTALPLLHTPDRNAARSDGADTSRAPALPTESELRECLAKWPPVLARILHRLAFRLGLSEGDLLDAVQEALCKASEVIASGEAAAMPDRGRWLVILARWRLHDVARERRQRPLSLTDFEPPIQPARSGDRRSSMLKAVSDAFAGLSARDQEVLRLHDIEQLTYKAAAAVLCVHPTRFNKLLARARRRLYRAATENLRREGFDPDELPIFSH